MIYIYAIKNIIDNKVYIGSTNNFKRRKYVHFYQLKHKKHNNILLQRVYDLYGKEKFVMYTLEQCEKMDRLLRELYYIDFYKSYQRDFGYNLLEPDNSVFKCDDMTKQKIVDSKIRLGINKPINAYYSNTLIFYKNYISVNECARELNCVSSSIIFDVLNKKNHRLSYKGFTFFYEGQVPFIRKSSKQRDMIKFRK